MRGIAADAHDAPDVFLYRDSSIAPLLDMRRRFKAVMDVLDVMIRHGASLSRSVELNSQWDEILALGPLYPVTLDDLHAVEGSCLAGFHRVVSGVHHRLSDFIHGVVVHRRDEAIRGGREGGERNRLREDPLVHPYKWHWPDLVPPAPFLQCSKDSSVVVVHGNRTRSDFGLDSVFVPHSRSFSLCSSVVSKVSNSGESINSCGEHGGALGHKNSCN